MERSDALTTYRLPRVVCPQCEAARTRAWCQATGSEEAPL